MLDNMIAGSRRLLAATFALTLGLAGLPGTMVATAADSPSTTLISSLPHPEPEFFRAEARLLVHTMPGIAGKPTPATTLLFVPRGKPLVGGWPIVAWAHGTTTPGQKTCAPSLSSDLDGGLTRDGFKSDYAFQIGELVNAGYAVVAPDLEGLGPVATVAHPYFGEASFARSLIAGVRAAREAEPTLSNRYAVVGHSEGGHGALDVDKHAAEAPELTLVAIVASAPYTSIAATALLSAERARAERDPAKAQSFRVTEQFQVMLMSAGVLAQSPDFDPSIVMGDDLKRVLPQFLASCSVPSIAVIQGAMKAGGASFAGLKSGWATAPRMRAFLATNDPAVTPGFTLRHPTLIVQGTSDPLVPEPLNTRFARQLRARGAPVTYKVYPGADHFTIIRAPTPTSSPSCASGSADSACRDHGSDLGEPVMTLSRNRQVLLTRRPQGAPVPEDFEMRDGDVPVPGDGQVLIENLFLSLDPYMRGRMNESEGSYAAPFALGEPLQGRTVARIAQSRNGAYEKGDLVIADGGGWQAFALSDGSDLRRLPSDMVYPSYALGVLGMTGFTAWHGLMTIGAPKAGETLVVAAASGAVGSVVGQIAKIKGCRVVGVAGGPEKCRYVVEELGFDAGLNHRDPCFTQHLADAVPNGVDIYFENVGGEVFEAVWPLLNVYARVPVCGLASGYNGSEPKTGPDRVPDLALALIMKRIRMQGYIISDHLDDASFSQFTTEMSDWLATGKVRAREDVTQGLEQAPAAMIGLLEGRNFGKALVKVAQRTTA